MPFSRRKKFYESLLGDTKKEIFVENPNITENEKKLLREEFAILTEKSKQFHGKNTEETMKLIIEFYKKKLKILEENSRKKDGSINKGKTLVHISAIRKLLNYFERAFLIAKFENKNPDQKTYIVLLIKKYFPERHEEELSAIIKRKIPSIVKTIDERIAKHLEETPNFARLFLGIGAQDLNSVMLSCKTLENSRSALNLLHQGVKEIENLANEKKPTHTQLHRLRLR